MQGKYCSHCHQYRGIHEFYYNKGKADGHMSECAYCNRARKQRDRENKSMTNYDKLEMMIDGNYKYDGFDTNGEKSMYLSNKGHYIAIHEEQDGSINVIWQYDYEVIADKYYKMPARAFKFIDEVLSGSKNYMLY